MEIVSRIMIDIFVIIGCFVDSHVGGSMKAGHVMPLPERHVLSIQPPMQRNPGNAEITSHRGRA
jgi:hypothetical protein